MSDCLNARPSFSLKLGTTQKNLNQRTIFSRPFKRGPFFQETDRDFFVFFNGEEMFGRTVSDRLSN